MVQVIHEPECANYQAEVYASPYNGFHFVRWNDDDTHQYRYLVVQQDTAIVAEFAEDQVSIVDVSCSFTPIVYVQDGYIRVTVNGNRVEHFTVYDMVGRCVLRIENGISTVPLRNGVYVIKVDGYPARSFVVAH